MKKKLKILITGPVPPPAGGISIHIQRLTHLLEDEFVIELIDESGIKKPGIFNIKSLNFISYIKKIVKADLLFVQSGNRLFKKLHILTGRLFAKKVIITIHGYGNKRIQPFRMIDSFIYGLAHKIILVNDHITEKVPLPANKCVVQHAFLPPVMNIEPPLPPVLAERITMAKNRNEIVICANASRLTLNNNVDLYGLDMCIELSRRLLAKEHSICFIFTVSALESGAELFNKNLQLINDQGLSDHFMLISEKLSFVRLIENADIVIRPTNTDGDALTVREAIYLGKPTIASDVIERPTGTILFKTRDNADLEIKTEEVIRKIRSVANVPLGVSNMPIESFKDFYSDLIYSVAVK